MAKRKSMYMKRRESIIRYVNRQLKRGIQVFVDYIPTERELRKAGIEKQALSAKTRQLSKLRKSLPQQEALSLETGELATPKELYNIAKELKRSENAIKFSDAVIRTYKQYILSFPKVISDIILTALNEAIAKSGKVAVAIQLESKALSLTDFLTRSAFYGDSIEAVIQYATAMFSDLPGMDDSLLNKLYNLVDEYENAEV